MTMIRSFLIGAAVILVVGCTATAPPQPVAFTCMSENPGMCELQRAGHDMRYRRALEDYTQQLAVEKAEYQRKADENCRFVHGADSIFC